MARCPIVVPEFGPDVATAYVRCWLVERGERVCSGDRVVDIVVPGFSVSITAPQDGVLVDIECRHNQPIAQGDVLGWIDGSPDVPGEHATS